MTERPRSALKRARHRAEATLFDALSAVAERASPRARRAVASVLGTLVWAIDVRHRRVARDNVHLAFGDTMSTRDARRLVLRSMRHFTLLAIETLAFRQYQTDSIDSRVCAEGLEHLRAAHARGRGVIGITGHLGHWELLAFMLGRLGMPATGIARPLDNPLLEARLMRLRTMSGNRIIDKHGAFPEALRVLRGGGVIGLWIDQRPKRGGIPVPFFGNDAYTTDGLARLVLASDAAVVPGFAFLEQDGSLRLIIEPEVLVSRTGDPVADAYRVTADCTAVIERWVRRYPEQWLWTHRRWAVPRPGAPRLSASEDPDAT